MTTTTLGTRLLQLGALGCAFTISACLVIREQKRANPEDPAPTNGESTAQSGVRSGTPANVALHSSKGISDTNLGGNDPVYILGSKSMALPDDYMVDLDGHLVQVDEDATPSGEFLYSSKSAAIDVSVHESAQDDIYLSSSKWGSIEMTENEEEIPALSSKTRPPVQPDNSTFLSSSKSLTPLRAEENPVLLPSSKSIVFEERLGTPEYRPAPISVPESALRFRSVRIAEYEGLTQEVSVLRKRVAELEAQIEALLDAQKDG
tara:strand:- start:1337 stop:2122 length:786 start_codon:yes stop_codon:yes gene_type:complete